jgi:adenylosuccinate lyase
MCIQTLNVILEYGVMIQNTVSVLIKSDKAGSKILARTHGKSAEVQTYRNIFNRWSNSLYSAFKLVRETKEKLAVGKLSGVSGNNIQNPYAREVNALRQLNLYPTSCSQIIPRTVFLDYFYAILKVVLAVEKIAYDIRMYSIDGINEMSEPFTKGQKGSSAMPHKKNPILTENICGLTRLYKSYFNTAIENCTTLFERDISHSSSERIIFKDAGHISCFTLKRLNEVLLGINLHTDNAQINCDKVKESISAQSKMMDNISCGLSRKESHDIQQEKSFIV